MEEGGGTTPPVGGAEGTLGVSTTGGGASPVGGGWTLQEWVSNDSVSIAQG